MFCVPCPQHINVEKLSQEERFLGGAFPPMGLGGLRVPPSRRFLKSAHRSRAISLSGSGTGP